MDGVDFLALIFAGVRKGEFGNPRGSFFRNDLQAFDHSGHDLMFQTGVKTFCVLAHDDQVHVGIASGDMRQIPDRPEIRVQVKLFAQRYVDAGKAAADRRGHRAF